MKYNIITLALLCISTSIFGQIQIGIKGQISSSLTSETSKEFVQVNPTSIYKIDFQTTNTRHAIGLSLYSENKYLFFTSDLLYSTSGKVFLLQSKSARRTPLDPSIIFNTKETNAKLVLNSGLRFNDIKIGVGPEFQYLISQEENLSLEESITTLDKKLNAGFNFLAGYVLGKHIHIDFKFTYMFQDVTNEFQFDGIPMNMKKNPKYLEVALAYYL